MAIAVEMGRAIEGLHVLGAAKSLGGSVYRRHGLGALAGSLEAIQDGGCEGEQSVAAAVEGTVFGR